VLDCVREVRPPFSPESVVSEFATLLSSYRVGAVRGDRYAGEWPREQFRKVGIDYLPADKNKSELYGALLPLLNSRRVDLLDDKKLVAEFVGLERRTARGRDNIMRLARTTTSPMQSPGPCSLRTFSRKQSRLWCRSLSASRGIIRATRAWSRRRRVRIWTRGPSVFR
jgi:hypothetical protein